MAIAALHRSPSRSTYVCKEQRRAYLTGNLAEIAVVPGGLDALEHGRFGAFSVPADPEAITVRRCRPETGVQALIDQ